MNRADISSPPVDSDEALRLRSIWTFIHMRCYYPTHRPYKNYGARGIVMCDEWRDNFEAFRLWAVTHGYDPSLTIDRIDNDKNYCPENCRWSTRREQSRNKRNNIIVTAFGETKCVQDWVKDPRFNISHQQLIRRIRKGIDPEKALTTHSQKRYFKSATEKECSGCHKIKSRSEFHPSGKPGPEPNRPKCKECDSEEMHQRSDCKRRYQKLFKGEKKRECGRCHKIKLNELFYPVTTKYGKVVPNSRCITCCNAIYLEQKAKRATKK